jgi:hypothetical protein
MTFVAAIWSSLSPMWVTVPGGMTVPTRFSCRRERERERGRCRGNPVTEDAQDDTENSPVYEIDQLVASQVVSQARRVKLLGIHGALAVGPVVRIELDCPEVVQRRQSQSAERLRGAEDR